MDTQGEPVQPVAVKIGPVLRDVRIVACEDGTANLEFEVTRSGAQAICHLFGVIVDTFDYEKAPV